MREQWRALMLLVRTTVRADPWRSAGLLLEPIGYLRVPLFALFLKLMVDGALRNDARLLAVGAAGITATRALWFLGMWTGSWIRARVREQVGFEFDRQIATLASRLPGLEHHERPEYQDRLEMLRQRQGLLGDSLNTLINTANAVVAGIGSLVALALVSPWLLLLVPFTLPAIPFAAVQQRWQAAAEERFGPEARRARHLHGLTQDRNAGMEFRVFGLEREILSRFRQAWLGSHGILLSAEHRAAVLNAARELVFLAGFVGAVGWMLVRAGRGQATVSDVVLTIYLGQQVQGSVVAPIQGVAGLGPVLRSARRLLWLQDYAEHAARTETGGLRPPERLTDGIVFDRVSFRYPGTKAWVLREVSLRIPAGAVIALVGENGAGKTTLVKLLSRMYEPTEGRILVDGVELADIQVDAWRERLTAAFQDFARFELTAQRSVGISDLPRLDDLPAVLVALEKAGAAGVPEALPQGMATQLGARWEGGVDLSTGQWQKLALGRALMRPDPLVVFFDEPTASLDAPTEHALFQRYSAAARFGSTRGAITVLVSHRFSTVRSADLILVIDGGCISELGDHEQLMRVEGLYSELYLLQARSYR